MPFDPSTRRETWCFLRVKRGKTSFLQRLAFNYVEYDGDPVMYLEPVPLSDFYYLDNTTMNIRHPDTSGTGKVARFEIFDIPPFEGLHAF